MLLMVGGTGDLGSRVTRRLREQGVEVRCLLRSGSDGTGLISLGADIAPGDLTNPRSLAAACAGVDTVVATATMIARRLDGARHPSIREADENGMRALVDAAEAAGVQRFVYLSYAGVDAGVGTPLERAKLAIESRLAETSMRPVVVRPDAFQEIHLSAIGRFDMAAGKVSVFGTGNAKVRWVSTEDAAALVAALAVEPDPPALVEFGGPEALSRNEAVALAEQLTGRPIKVQRMPARVARLGIRVLNRRNDALASVFGTGLVQESGSKGWDDQPLRDRGISAKPASEFLREQAALLAPG